MQCEPQQGDHPQQLWCLTTVIISVVVTGWSGMHVCQPDNAMAALAQYAVSGNRTKVDDPNLVRMGRNVRGSGLSFSSFKAERKV